MEIFRFKRKSEAQNPNVETNSNVRNSKSQNQEKNKFWPFEHSNLEFVSDFDIRISDF